MNVHWSQRARQTCIAQQTAPLFGLGRFPFGVGQVGMAQLLQLRSEDLHIKSVCESGGKVDKGDAHRGKGSSGTGRPDNNQNIERT